jgi:hypothetical protein
VDQEAIANLGESFDEFGMFRRVFERLPKLFHGGIHAMLEVYKGVLRPQCGAQLLAPDDLAVRLQEQPKDLERLILYRHTNAQTEQLIAV